MRLARLKVAFVVAAAAIGCSDATGPTTIPGVFVLQAVNGRPLPVEIGLGIGGPPVLLSGTLTLNADGTAVVVERTRLATGAETTSTGVLGYELDGHNIFFVSSNCTGAPSICVPVKGVLVNSSLSLRVVPGPDGFTYLYHRLND